MEQLTTNIIGYAATVIGTSMMVPQIIKFIRTKKAEDVSLGMAVLYLLNCLLWLAYGWRIGATPVVLANGIGLVISVIQVALRQKYARAAAARAKAQ